DQLFRGLNCTEQSAELRASTRTLSVCTPMVSQLTLSVPISNSICLDGPEFTLEQIVIFPQHFCAPQAECLQSILEDLRYYWAMFKSYLDPDRILEQSVLRNIEDLMKSCFAAPLQDSAQVQISVDIKNSFERRLKLCKVLKGFQIRTITINRALNHIVHSSQI
ncbi:hypothetical protein QTP70_025179, partial [Hemibagrus guttatus]